jgi:exopolysaccharide biosynthesis polyprenyl glycosylphosphotransferase
MIKKQAKIFTGLQYAIDMSLTVLSLLLAYYLRFNLAKWFPQELYRFLFPELHPLASYLRLLLLIVPLWSLLYVALKLYRVLDRVWLREQAQLLLKLEIISGILLGFALFILRINLSRTVIMSFLAINFLLLFLERVGLKLKLKYFREDRKNFRSILIVGLEEQAKEIGRLIKKYKDWGLNVIGYVSTEEGLEHNNRMDIKILGSLKDIPGIIERNIIDEIIFVSSDKRDLEKFEEVFLLCEEQGIRMRLAVNLFPRLVSRVSMEYLDHVPLITFSTVPDHELALFAKRVLDLVLTSILLVLLSPLMLIVAILVKLTSEGPAIYKQTRCGLYGRRFTLYKFRSMVHGAEDVLWEIKHLNEMSGPVFKMRNDPRVTKLGKILRKTSIDELPQLYNVLKGDMSLVGPRAPLPEEVKEYTRWQRRRLSVKPGITCLWQVSGRNEIDFNEWMNMDLQYIDNWSLALDLKILLKTIPTVLLAKGAR